MSQELAIIQQENISTIVQAAPQSYQDNRISAQRCKEAGENLLLAIAEQGMTDELDQRAASFIEKTRKTIKKMNERRAPVTRLFDDIRKEFTALENSIDPSKSESVAYKLQAYRDAYAAKKRAEEEQRRREEMARQQAETARRQYAMDVENDLKAQLAWEINSAKQVLEEVNEAVTLKNYDSVYAYIKKHSTELDMDWGKNLCPKVRRPFNLPAEEAKQIEQDTKARLMDGFYAQYRAEIEDTKAYILDRLPSRKAELERIAKANAEDVERLRKEMEERQRREQEERAQQEQRKAEEARKAEEMAQAQAEMASLFEQQQVAQPVYQPKTKVTQKINLLNPEGIMPVIGMWWSHEGCHMTTEELAKMFKKQITFCEKLANKDSVYITDESVEYVDVVKAK